MRSSAASQEEGLPTDDIDASVAEQATRTQMFQRWTSATHERADDLKRTLGAFDGSSLVRPDGHEHVLNTFSKLSNQLTLLQERQAEPSAVALLERHFAVPSAVAGLDAALRAYHGRHMTAVRRLGHRQPREEPQQQPQPAADSRGLGSRTAPSSATTAASVRRT